jgi:hypothetical protein
MVPRKLIVAEDHAPRLKGYEVFRFGNKESLETRRPGLHKEVPL